MQMTRKRTALLVMGLILGGWLVFSQYNQRAEPEIDQQTVTTKTESGEPQGELRVRLLLLGAEFVIQRTTQSR